MRWLMTFTITVLIGFLMPASGRLTPYVLDWPHRLTTATLTAYVNKTFGPLQRCLKVAADDTDEAAAIVAMLHPQRDNDSAGGHLSDVDAPTRTLALDAYGDVPVFCTAYMVIGRRLETIEKYFEYFRSDVAERMLVVVVQNRKYIKPFIKVSSTHVLPPHQSHPLKLRGRYSRMFCLRLTNVLHGQLYVPQYITVITYNSFYSIIFKIMVNGLLLEMGAW